VRPGTGPVSRVAPRTAPAAARPAARAAVRAVLATVTVAAIAALTACAPELPHSVVPGTSVGVAWDGALTTLNPARATATSGDADIAELTRARFAHVVDGEVVPDESFGTVTIAHDDPFTLRYDLAEPAWSDGIPLDAADLVLAWAAASNFFAPDGFDPEARRDEDGTVSVEEGDVWFDAAPGGLGDSAARPEVDEFARAIEVRLHGPVRDWQTALDVAVPAHVVAERAWGIDDPMEAKQAVLAAVRDGDDAALDRLARAWNAAFAVVPDGTPDADLMLSSGPFVIERIERDGPGQSVALAANASYRGEPTPQVARLRLVPEGDDPLTELGASLDVVSLAPTVDNRARVRELERTDHDVTSAHDGTLWALLLRPNGIFASSAARTAFLHAVPRQDIVSAAAGEWDESYTHSDAMLFAPTERAYEIAMEDAGFRAALGTPAGRPQDERRAAGVRAGARVCVLYDRTAEFAAALYAQLRAAMAEPGWDVTDCGSDDVDAARQGARWDAVIARVPIPDTPAQIAEQWGPRGTALPSDPEREELIARLAETADPYEARDVRVAIEASIVRTAVALPLAVNPRVTVVDTDVAGVVPRAGAVSPLMSGATGWSAAGG
jgi:peptide/nickel transport system substrate-binding protein